jgi:hypothetical protein
MVMAVLTLAFVCIPFIPGLRDIPRWIPVYRLLNSFASTPRTSIYVNSPDSGAQSSHASAVFCAVKVR